jgi:hypothetical protein
MTWGPLTRNKAGGGTCPGFKPGRHYKLLASADLKQPRESWFVVDQFEVPADEEGSAIE